MQGWATSRRLDFVQLLCLGVSQHPDGDGEIKGRSDHSDFLPLQGLTLSGDAELEALVMSRLLSSGACEGRDSDLRSHLDGPRKVPILERRCG